MNPSIMAVVNSSLAASASSIGAIIGDEHFYGFLRHIKDLCRLWRSTEVFRIMVISSCTVLANGRLSLRSDASNISAPVACISAYLTY